MRLVLTLTVAALAAASAGCIASYKLGESDLDRYASLHGTADLGPPYRPSMGGRALPAKWIIRQRPGLVWSTISLVRAADRLKQGAAEIELSVSPAHAKSAADVLAQARLAIRDVDEIARSDRSVDRHRWAQGLAAALGRVEVIARQTSIRDTDEPDGRGDEPMGLAAGPMLALVTAYLNEQAAGSLLADLRPEDVDQVRTVLVQVVLRIGFAAAGRQLPEDLRDAVVAEMLAAEDLADLQESLAALLEERVEHASPDAAGGELAATVRTVLAYAPKALKALESFVRQWDRVEAIEVELHRAGDQTVVAVTVRVRPGKEVRLDDMVMFQPAIVFRGATRIVVRPSVPGTGETQIAFEPVDDGGAVEMRFEGFAYGIARMMVMPLASGALREVRVFARTSTQGEQVVNVAVLMEATGDKGDPRRLLHFQDVRHKRLVRGPFDIRNVEEGKEQIFNYLTPDRRYTFRRVQTPAAK
ncbi:MAG TPA: hypothetical protein VM431_14555 [Phycisphaerae bacterium]|nr:hypothetical protein [Phycisphaerae bacterium]